VISTRKLWVRAWVDETSLGDLRVGQLAQVALRSHPAQVFPGRVDRIGRQADRQTHELLVDVELLQLPPGFAVGQRADVRISVAGKASALRIPTSFLNQGKGTCSVNKSGRIHQMGVKTGFAGSDFVEIQEGLQAGDQVLRSPQEGKALPSLRRVRVKEAL
jgi:HlyD family secretion protein